LLIGGPPPRLNHRCSQNETFLSSLSSFLLSACGWDACCCPSTKHLLARPCCIHSEIYTDLSQTVEARVEDLLARMTLDEKIGQMTQVEKNSIAPGDITKYHIGSILSGGGGSPSENTPQAWYAMVEGFQNEALETRLRIPIIYGVDAVHGHGNLLNATIFPQQIGLRAIELMESWSARGDTGNEIPDFRRSSR
jgi:hypothetical protein